MFDETTLATDIGYPVTLPNEVPTDPPGETDFPDIPILGDISGLIHNILDWLNRFWEKLQELFDALVDSLVTSLIGDGQIDFSRLNGHIEFSTVFPFCIPFDFINAIKSLVVSPAVPRWEVDLSGTVLGDTSIVIDMAKFESVAQVARFFEFLAFAVGLMLATRKLIKW